MLLYCPVWLYFLPGLIGFITGLFLLIILQRGPLLFLGHSWDIHFIAFASVTTILFYQVLNLGIYAHTYAIKERLLKYDSFTLFFQRHFSLEKGLLLGLIFYLRISDQSFYLHRMVLQTLRHSLSNPGIHPGHDLAGHRPTDHLLLLLHQSVILKKKHNGFLPHHPSPDEFWHKDKMILDKFPDDAGVPKNYPLSTKIFQWLE